MSTDRVRVYRTTRSLVLRLAGARVCAITFSKDATVKPALILANGVQRLCTCAELRRMADVIHYFADEQQKQER